MSHVISAFAGKPIFGRDGPKYQFYISQQTICRKVSILLKQDTIQVSHIFLFKFDKLYNLFVVIVLKRICACISTNLRLVVYTLVLVTKFVFSYNPQITKARIYLIYKFIITSYNGLSMLVGISEAICLLFFILSPIRNPRTKRNYSSLFLPTNTNKVGIQNPNDTCNIFNQWLAGLIDGDGCFLLSKKGYASLEIVMEIRDKHFKLCPSRSAKQSRLKAIERYLELRDLKAHLASDNSILGKAWKQFLLKWDKFEK